MTAQLYKVARLHTGIMEGVEEGGASPLPCHHAPRCKDKEPVCWLPAFEERMIGLNLGNSGQKDGVRVLLACRR